MSKIKKRKLRWEASESSQVVGYKLYWSESGEVGYDSQYVRLGKVTEIILPDDVEAFTPGDGPIAFGITAYDELGNESDMTTFVAPYQFSVPQAPVDLWVETLEDYYVSAPPRGESEEKETGARVENLRPVKLRKPAREKAHSQLDT